MFRDRSSTLIRLGILALPAAGLLGLVGLLSRYSVPNPRVDPEAAARFASSSHYFASQFAGNVVGLTLLIFGILALTAFLSETRVRGLSALGVTTYALPVLGRAYLGGQSDALVIVHTIFHNPLRVIFVPAFLSYGAGFILFCVAIWRSEVLRKGAAISLGLHAPLVSTFVRPQPSPVVVLGALLFILGSTLIALDVLRGTSRGSRSAAGKASPDDPTR
jgi:hypothetical protein